MIDWLAKHWIKNYTQTNDPVVRQGYGMLSGGVGIFCNLLLFLGKLLAGTVSGSISMVADAFNNLSDAGSSVVTLIGFKMAGQKADRDHPFGHGRMEYLAGLLVAVMILLVGAELFKSSLAKALHPAPVELTLVSLVVLPAAILVKLGMWRMNKGLGKKLHSPALEATAADSISDVVATGAVLGCTLLGHFTGWEIDGWAGLGVACFILYSGVMAARDTLNPLLGQPPAPELVQEIEETVLAHPEVRGVHDLVVHDYGPGRAMGSLHAEVDARADLLQIHDCIDRIERELKKKFGFDVVIHMDPVETGNGRTEQLRKQVLARLQEVWPGMTLHDFRITAGPEHTNLIFDVVAPYDIKLGDEELRKKIGELVRELGENYYAVVQVDRAYV